MAIPIIAAFSSAPILAQNISKPYDEKLFRLSKLLGAAHYLRELCDANDGQKWRDNMKALLEAEGISPARKAAMSRHFNRGYRGYSRTYRSCTPPARDTTERFMEEAISITDELIKFSP